MANEGFNIYVKKDYVDAKGGGGGGAAVDLSAYAKKTEVDPKADKSYVDAELAKKAAATDVTAKADKTYVNTELAKKVDKTTKFVTNVTLSGKVITVTYSDNTTATLTLA